MKKLKIIFWAFLALALLNIALSHEGEFNNSNEFHFFHMGKLTFPVWTYWAEIVEHFAVILIVLIGLFLFYKRLKGEKYNLFKLGFIIILIAEIFTLLHHFLFFPFGIFNAVINHALLFAGILILVFGLLKIEGDGN